MDGSVLIDATALGHGCAQVGNVLADHAQGLFGRHAEGISGLRHLRGMLGVYATIGEKQDASVKGRSPGQIAKVSAMKDWHLEMAAELERYWQIRSSPRPSGTSEPFKANRGRYLQNK